MDKDIPMRDADSDSDLEDAIPATPEIVPARAASSNYTTTLATAELMRTQAHAAAAFNEQLLQQAACRRYAAQQLFNSVGSQPAAWQRLMVDGAELQREAFVREHFGPQTPNVPYQQTDMMQSAPAATTHMRPAVQIPAFVQGVNVLGSWSEASPPKPSQTQSTSSDSDSDSGHVPTRSNAPPRIIAKSAQYGWDMSIAVQAAKAAKSRKPWEDDKSEEDKVDAGDEEEEVYVPRPTRTRNARRTG
ncbi:hypothetical protein LTR95_001970 [Oleoguttula sp. CCFEE 5521]